MNSFKKVVNSTNLFQISFLLIAVGLGMILYEKMDNTFKIILVILSCGAVISEAIKEVTAGKGLVPIKKELMTLFEGISYIVIFYIGISLNNEVDKSSSMIALAVIAICLKIVKDLDAVGKNSAAPHCGQEFKKTSSWHLIGGKA